MSSSKDLRDEIECLRGEVQLLESQIVKTTHCYVNQIKGFFSFGNRISSTCGSSGYAGRAPSSNLMLNVVHTLFSLTSPFLVTLLTPRVRRWYTPLLAKLVDSAIRTLGCINYPAIIKLVARSFRKN